MSITKKNILKNKFAIEILPILKTLDFEYKNENTEREKETYFKIGNVYYYIRKSYFGGYTDINKNFIEYRFMKQYIPFYNSGSYNPINYYDYTSEKCWITLIGKNDYNKYNKKNDYEIENYYIQYYNYSIILKNKCIFCDKKNKYFHKYFIKHDTKTITHLKNKNNFILELSKSSRLNIDCINNIFSFFK